jgi:transcriptional regulator with XRE-family HTH domain
MRTSDINQLSDTAILERLGQRLARYRLNRNLTQDQVALEAGVSRRSVSKLENGHIVDTRILIRILRALDLINQLDALAPEVEASPISLLEARGKERLRASGSRERSPSSVAEPPGNWTWPDDHK